MKSLKRPSQRIVPMSMSVLWTGHEQISSDNTSRRDAEERVQNCSLAQHLEYFDRPQCTFVVFAMSSDCDISNRFCQYAIYVTP